MNPRVDLCCNDPDNGLFAGRVAAVQVGDLELYAFDMRGPKLREEAGNIVIAGKRFPVANSKEWLGNWCWNAYWMTPETCVDFLIWAHRRGFFGVESAEQRIFNLWQSKAPLSEARDFLERYFSKPSVIAPITRSDAA